MENEKQNEGSESSKEEKVIEIDIKDPIQIESISSPNPRINRNNTYMPKNRVMTMAEIETEKKLINMQQSQLDIETKLLKDKKEKFDQRFFAFIREKDEFYRREKKLREVVANYEDIIQSHGIEEIARQQHDEEIKRYQDDILNEKQQLIEQLNLIKQQLDNLKTEKQAFEEEKQRLLDRLRDAKQVIRDPKSEAAFVDYERNILELQRKQFYEEKKGFEIAQERFQQRFTEYLQTKENQQVIENRLKEDQKNVELLREALIQSQDDIKNRATELKAIEQRFSEEKKRLDEAWKKISDEIQKIKKAKIIIDEENQKLELKRKDILEEAGKNIFLAEHYNNVLSAVDKASKQAFLNNARLFINNDEETALTGMDKLHEYVKNLEYDFKKKENLRQKHFEELENSMRNEKLLQLKEISQLKSQNRELLQKLEQANVPNKDNSKFEHALRKEKKINQQLKQQYEKEFMKRKELELILQRVLTREENTLERSFVNSSFEDN